VAGAVNGPGATDFRSLRLAHGDVATRRTHDGVLILPLGTSACDEAVMLTGSATALWDAFATAGTVDDAVTSLAARFGADAQPVGDAFEPVVRQLVAISALVESR
jgi:Coenzyme PQQ synthesis protein D (PqqD)